MAECPSDSPPAQDVVATAVSAFRETAKWLVGGAVATAAGIFTGSTLTNFGQLPIDWRFWIAVGGLFVGFSGIALLIHSAMKVIVSDAVSFKELARALPDRRGSKAVKSGLAPEQLRFMRSEVDRLCRTRPCRLPSYAAVFEAWEGREPESKFVSYFIEDNVGVADPARVSLKREVDPNSVKDAKVDELREFLLDALVQANFFKVQYAFIRLRNRVPLYILLMVLGFGSFAWAANPPDPPARKPGITVNWP